MKIKGFTVESTEIEIDEEEYRQAKLHEALDGELDTYLSDMDGETVVVEEDGTVINPYGGTADLLELITPLLDCLPTWQVEQYVTGRRMDEE